MPPYTSSRFKITLPKILLFVSIIFTLVVSYMIYDTSFIKITATGSDIPTGSFDYTITNTGTGKVTSGHQELPIKKRVGKGKYNILVNKGGRSYFSAVSTDGFLKTVAVGTVLQSEKSRYFVGNNPGPCMEYINSRLITYTCTDLLSKINTHVAATITQPTYTVKNPRLLPYGYVEGVVNLGGSGNFILLQTPTESEEGQHHIMYPLYDDLSTGPVEDYTVGRNDDSGIHLDELKPDKFYKTMRFRDGFLAYDSGFESVFYYTSPSSKPDKIVINRPKDVSFQPVSLDVSGNQIIAVFSSNKSVDQKSDTKSSTKIVIYQDGKNTEINLGKGYSLVKFCGQNRICAVGRNMDIFSISAKRIKHLQSISGVISTETVGERMLVIRQKEVLNLDVTSLTGSIDYSFGDYTYSNTKVTENGGYLLSITRPDKKKVALFIDSSSSNTDNIDKKALELQNKTNISDVSIYKGFIYVSPNLGEFVYNPANKSFGYDPSRQKSAAEQINNYITDLGIDRSKYTVINSAKP